MNLTTSTVDLSTTLHLKRYNLLTGESQQALKILFYDEPEYALSLRKVCAILNARRPFNLNGEEKKKKKACAIFLFVCLVQVEPKLVKGLAGVRVIRPVILVLASPSRCNGLVLAPPCPVPSLDRKVPQ